MATKKKLLQAAAGSASGGAEGLNVEQVFSTYVYEGNGSEQFIDNGINLGQANDGYSAYFGGSGYYVGAEQTTLTDFTVEGWFYFSNLASNRTLFTLGYADLQLYYRSASSNLAIYDTSAKTYSWTPTGSTWYHIALVRSGSSVELFVDGVSKGTQTSSATISGDLIIGGYAGATDPMNGYISNIRVSDNVRYSSNFTAPTSALTTDANTTLLTLQDDTFIDNSGNGNVITPSGGAEMVSHAPFTAADAGEGGLVWIKNREQADDHYLGDSERGFYRRLESNNTDAQVGNANGTWSFNSNGFTIPNFTQVNTNGENYASWTFRKAPKFFDVVTYTGDGTSSQQITHNLGVTPGLIIVKAASSVGSNANWLVWHRSLTQSAGYLNSTNAFGGGEYTYNFNQPSDTYIDVKKVGSFASGTNDSGITYVAYLFAHNDGDGDFGPTGDQDIIKCGSYTGNGSTDGPEINLGFEPQWVLWKNANRSDASWCILDNMRGINTGSNDPVLITNSSGSEWPNGNYMSLTATGFKITTTETNTNASGDSHIYIAIRRGPMAVPTDATDVFSVTETSAANNAEITIGFPTDLHIANFTSGDSTSSSVYDRLRGFETSAANGTGLITSSLNAENTNYNIMYAPNMTGYKQGNYYANSNSVRWDWKRAPNYFDVVAYSGNSTAGRAINHNLGVAPEMIWVKNRTTSGYQFIVWHKDLSGNNYNLYLNGTNAENAHNLFSTTAPDENSWYTGTQYVQYHNDAADDYIAYLFASLDGVSKVGSYTGTGSTQTIDCGFSSGARFVLIKRTSGSAGWFVFDTERGIVAGDDPYLFLNDTVEELTSLGDAIDPNSAGFDVVSSNADINGSGETYIFYAIA